MAKTFKELNKDCTIEKVIKKAGLSLAIIFSKDDIKRFNLNYNDKIVLDNAILVKINET